MSASTQTAKPQPKLARYFPILTWLSHYDRAWLRGDIVAGLTLWGLVVPEAMAYAGIAGLPPQAGLYTLLASCSCMRCWAPRAIWSCRRPRRRRRCWLRRWPRRSWRLRPTRGRPSHLPGLCVGLRVGHRSGLSGRGVAKLGFITQFLSKPVMERLCDGTCALRGGGPAQQTLWRAQAGGQRH
jgi:hypothetical protein